MVFEFNDQKLMIDDLTNEYKEQLREMLTERVKNDECLMALIKSRAKEKETSEELTIDEAIERGISRVRIYCDFDVVVEE